MFVDYETYYNQQIDNYVLKQSLMSKTYQENEIGLQFHQQKLQDQPKFNTLLRVMKKSIVFLNWTSIFLDQQDLCTNNQHFLTLYLKNIKIIKLKRRKYHKLKDRNPSDNKLHIKKLLFLKPEQNQVVEELLQRSKKYQNIIFLDQKDFKTHSNYIQFGMQSQILCTFNQNPHLHLSKLLFFHSPFLHPKNQSRQSYVNFSTLNQQMNRCHSISNYILDQDLKNVRHSFLQFFAEKKSRNFLLIFNSECLLKKRTIKEYILNQKIKEINKQYKKQFQVNSQSSFNLFHNSSEDEETASILLKKVNRQLRKSNIFSLKHFWNQQFQQFLLSLLKNSDIYSWQHNINLFLFLKLNEFKMFSLQHDFQDNLYEKIYPGLKFILKSIQQKLQVASLFEQRNTFKDNLFKDIKQTNIKQLTKETINEMFLEQLRKTYKIQKESKNQKAFFKQLKQFLKIVRKNVKTSSNNCQKTLEQHLSIYLQQSVKFFPSKVQFQQASENIRCFINQNLSLYKFNEKKLQKNIDYYFNQIQSERVNQSKCLGCSPVFIINKNIYDPTISSIPIKNFPTINKLKDYQVEFKDTICALLNNGGGVILFDCNQINQKLYARGQYLTERSKEQIEQRITSYFRWFYPRPQINTNIKISFIPLVKLEQRKQEDFLLGFQKPKGSSSHNFKTSYLDGLYVTRLRIAPSQGCNVYFWFHNKKQPLKDEKQEIATQYCSVLDHQNKPKLINFGQFRRLIKKRVQQNHISYDSYEIMLKKPANIFGHQCFQPQKGKLIARKQNKHEIISVQPQVGKQKMNLSGITVLLQSKYNFMTLLIAKKDDLPRIKQKLIDSGIQCQIQVRFAKHNLKPANNAAILYHDKNFEVIHDLIAHDPRFRFSTGKPFMVLNVTKFLRFQLRNQRNKLDNSTMMKCNEWLSKEFQNEKINFYEYQMDHKKKEYYLQTNSKLSLLFMYFMINHYGEKVSLKNPYNLQKYSIQQKMNQLKKITTYREEQVQKNERKPQKHLSKEQSCKFQISVPVNNESTQKNEFQNFIQEEIEAQDLDTSLLGQERKEDKSKRFGQVLGFNF